ncbi:acetate uptake transporter [Streptomyces sp. NK08204]|uniref:acetate uptake transporter n=1 Tax=Streptomyces sp. NK08204 TaxID=2873260 RepID=UPI001CEDB738|nr:acetate uptake transporter [Streptomyces sp. NK08204]
MTQIQTPVTDERPAASSQPAPAAPEVQHPPIADPGPLGLAAFALTTFVLSVFNAGLIKDASLEAVVLPLALWYGGTVQVLAGMWEFRKNNTFGALAFTSYGAFWLSFASYVQFVAPKLPAAHAYQATGLFLLAWTIFTAFMTIVAARINGVLLAVFSVLSVTFVLLTAGKLGENAELGHAGGWAGLITALLAWYGSFAGVANATWKNKSLPTWPFSA